MLVDGQIKATRGGTLMNRLGITAIVPAVTMLFASANVAMAAQAPGKTIEKWEYAEVHSWVDFSQNPTDGPPTRLRVRWLTAGEVIDTNGWEEMATKIKAPPPKKETPGLSQRLRVFNHLGGQGWGLVSHEQKGNPAEHTWLFKRRVP
jgi:hypothetical protein